MTAPSALRVAGGAGAFPSCDQVKAVHTVKVASSSQGHIDKKNICINVYSQWSSTFSSHTCLWTVGGGRSTRVMNPSSHGENMQSHNLTKNLYSWIVQFPAKTTRHYKFVQQKAQHFNSRANPRLYKITMLTIFKHQSQYCKLSLWCCKTLQTLHVIFKVCVSTYNTAWAANNSYLHHLRTEQN